LLTVVDLLTELLIDSVLADEVLVYQLTMCVVSADADGGC